jgi:hypothetical protein
VKQTINDAQNPMLGQDPYNRLINREAMRLSDKKREFEHASKAKQQQMLGSGSVEAFKLLAPFAKGTGIAEETTQSLTETDASLLEDAPVDNGFRDVAEWQEGAPQRLLAQPKTIRHHLFNKFRGASPTSQKYRDFFAKHGIDVDRFTVEIPESMHQKLIHRAGNNWTTRWKQWIDANPNATTKDVYQFAGRMMDEYGVSGLQIVPYR